jgi:O-Antigen ligase
VRAAAAVAGRGLPASYVRTVAPVFILTILSAAVAGARVAVAVAVVMVLLIGYSRVLTDWRTLLCALIGVILFIPIGRYTLPASLPFRLEPYRIFVAALLLVWLSSLLIDSRVKFRLGLVGAPLLLLVVVTLASDFANTGRIHQFAVSSTVAKRLTFFASFVLVYFLVVSLVRRSRDLQGLVKMMVIGGSVVAAFGLVEYTSGYNVFNHFQGFIPLHAEALPYTVARGSSRLRVYASAEHPIALGALFVLLLPLSGYLWQATRQRRWWVAAALLLMGTFSTQSRTAMIMLVVVVLVLLRLRPQSIRPLWPLLLPALLAIHFAVPGSIGSISSAFFPKGGLVAQQQSGAGTYGSGRIADLGPSLHEYAGYPVLGEGYGTRVTDKGPAQNANILDDQWLSTMLETGALGALAWIWIFSRSFRRLSRAAKEDDTPRGWLCAALAAALLAFSVGMLTFDAFSFAQVTFAAFIVLGLGSALLEIPALQWRSPVRAA